MSPLIAVFFLSNLCTSLAMAAPVSARTTLAETVHLAIERSPLVDAARKQKEARDLEYQNAVGVFLPSLDAAATHGLKETNAVGTGGPVVPSTPGEPWSSALTLGVTETLYDNGESFTKLKAAKLKRELADVSYSKTRDQLVLDVMTQFYTYSLARLRAEAKREYRSTLEKQYQQLSRQYLQGFKTKVDFLRFKTRVQIADARIVSADNATELARIDIARLLGSSSAQTLPEFEPLAVAESVPAIPSGATTPRYEKQILDLQRQVNETEVRFARRRWLPEATLGGGVTYANSNYLGTGTQFDTNDTLSWNVLLTLKYNLWDWGIRKNNVAIAEATRDAANDSLAQAFEDATARSLTVAQNLKTSETGLKLAREILALEEQNFSNLSRDYREGRTTYLDLVTGLENLLTAREDYYSSYFDILKTMAQHNYYRGQLHETFSGK